MPKDLISVDHTSGLACTRTKDRCGSKHRSVNNALLRFESFTERDLNSDLAHFPFPHSVSPAQIPGPLNEKGKVPYPVVAGHFMTHHTAMTVHDMGIET